MVKMTTFQFLLHIVADEDLELIKLDVKMSFLHGDLEEDVYIEHAKGFTKSNQQCLVCRLKKSLYGLKQAPQ